MDVKVNALGVVFVLAWKLVKGLIVGCFTLIAWIFSNLLLLGGLAFGCLMAWGFLLLLFG